MSRAELADTPFDGFLTPGMILSIIVGGGLLTAAWTVWMRYPLGASASLVAGCILLGWIVVEAVLIDDGRPLQATIFVLALMTLGLAWLLGICERSERTAQIEREET